MWPISSQSFEDHSSLTYALTDEHPDGSWFIMCIKRGGDNEATMCLEYYEEQWQQD